MGAEAGGRGQAGGVGAEAPGAHPADSRAARLDCQEDGRHEIGPAGAPEPAGQNGQLRQTGTRLGRQAEITRLVRAGERERG